MHYFIQSEKGFWLPDSMGYTRDVKQAGVFSGEALATLCLDGCTLHETDAKPAPVKPSRLQAALERYREVQHV